MDIQLFIQNVADQFDELNVELTPRMDILGGIARYHYGGRRIWYRPTSRGNAQD